MGKIGSTELPNLVPPRRIDDCCVILSFTENFVIPHGKSCNRSLCTSSRPSFPLFLFHWQQVLFPLSTPLIPFRFLITAPVSILPCLASNFSQSHQRIMTGRSAVARSLVTHQTQCRCIASAKSRPQTSTESKTHPPESRWNSHETGLAWRSASAKQKGFHQPRR